MHHDVSISASVHSNLKNSNLLRISNPNRRLAFQFLAPALLFLCMAGCSVGPNYKRPDVHLPAEFRGAPIPISTNSFADLPWWEIFQDEDLRALIRVAFTNNNDLRQAIARVEQAQGFLQQARSGFFPQL